MFGKIAVYLLAMLFVSPVFIGGLWLKGHLIAQSGGTLPPKAADLPLYFMLGSMLMGTVAGILAQTLRSEFKKQKTPQ
ncbi:hypothetical protein ACP3TJ_03715 [Desulforudis sp. 1088]|uniref:hypothetical protein n=1 Tax=unclassified Candidatus Desulforudis TaxID=2635950 RepID=UPI003478E269